MAGEQPRRPQRRRPGKARRAATKAEAGDCPSGKRQLFTRDAATVQGEITARRAGRPLRTYRCPDCGTFHLTKKKPYGRFAVGKREGRA